MRINGASVQPVQKRFGFFNMLFDFQIVKRFYNHDCNINKSKC